jgi:NAD+ kinase
VTASGGRRVAIVLHRNRPEAVELARQAVAWLVGRGHEVRVPSEDASVTGLEEWSCPEEKLAHDLDLAVSLGGDGTILRTVDMVCPAGVPVLGINVGHLGYLTECEPGELWTALDRFFAGDHGVEERMMLEVCPERPGVPERVSALNEAWLERSVPGHMVRMEVTLGGRPFITYAADGLIVATPTGSTAYNLSVRGPILSPTLRALVMTPVSPHQLFDFSLVLDPSEDVRVEVLEGRGATLLVDGRAVSELQPGDAVTCRAGAHPARLVTFGPRNFHRILRAKFGLADR